MRILTEMPGPTDGTQWYRGAGPLSAMSKQVRNLHIEYRRDIDWGTLKSSDILFLLRPSTSRQLSYIQLAHDLGVKVWVDYDDYLLDLPKDNPAFGYFCNPEIQQNIQLCIAQADLVSVSTGKLLELFTQYNKNIRVIPNAIDDSLLRHMPKKPPNKTIVLWRGTGTHQRDLMDFKDEIIRVSKKDESIKFTFVGYNPWFITEELPRSSLYFPPVDLFQFNQALCALRPKLTIVPLHDSDFNRSKSNIAALEGSMAGGAVLAPNWEEWQMPGVFNYDNKKHFGEFLEHALCEGEMVEDASKSTWNHISQHLLLSKVNEDRLQIMKELYR